MNDRPNNHHAALLAGALEQLIRHQLSGCERAARLAARLLGALAERPEMNGETRYLCDMMCERLESSHG